MRPTTPRDARDSDWAHTRRSESSQASGCVIASQFHEVAFLLSLAQRKPKPEFLKYTKQLPNRYRPARNGAGGQPLEYEKADVQTRRFWDQARNIPFLLV